MKFLLIGRKTWRPSFAIAVAALGASALLAGACSDADPPSQDLDSGGEPSTTGGTSGESGGSPSEGGDGPGTGGTATGGVGTGGAAPVDPDLVVAEIEDLAVTSALYYEDNKYGVITGSTLAAYYNDWEANRPAGVTGRLIILQVLPSGLAARIIDKNETKGVFSYILPAASVAQARNNGISNFETDIPDGPTADALLKLYGIDPTQDFIVLTFEAPTGTANSVVQSVGRAWVFFNYWGWPKERLAILNGSIDFNAPAGFPIRSVAQQKFSIPQDNGTKSFKDLKRDQTVVSISLEEVLEILDEPEDGPTRSKVRIVDARGGAEALGLKKATSTGRTKCTSFDPGTPAVPAGPGVPAVPAVPGNPLNQKCSTPFEGRIKSAKSVPWTGFLQNIANGYRFLSPAQAKVLFDQQSGWVDGTHELTVQYCRTNQRSTVTGIVANLILGYPTRLYETSFIEWGHLSAGPDDELGEGGAPATETFPNKSLVGESFAFRTDLAQYTEHATLHPDDAGAYVPGGTLGTLTKAVTWHDGPNYNEEEDINPPSTNPLDLWPKLNPAGETTRASIDADKAYLSAD